MIPPQVYYMKRLKGGSERFCESTVIHIVDINLNLYARLHRPTVADKFEIQLFKMGEQDPEAMQFFCVLANHISEIGE